MPQYTPRRKLIEKRKQHQEKKERWRNRFSIIKRTVSTITHEHKEPVKPCNQESPVDISSTNTDKNSPKTTQTNIEKIKQVQVKPKNTKLAGAHTTPKQILHTIHNLLVDTYIPKLRVIMSGFNGKPVKHYGAIKHIRNKLSNYKLLFKFGNTIRKRVNVTGRLWGWRYYSCLTIITLLLINQTYHTSHINKLYSRFPYTKNINKYPALPSSWLNLSKQYFLRNQEEESRVALERAKQYIQLSHPISTLLYKNTLNETETLLQSPQRRREQLARLAQLLDKYPYSWQLLALKSHYEQELYDTQKHYSTLQQTQWLNPLWNSPEYVATK